MHGVLEKYLVSYFFSLADFVVGRDIIRCFFLGKLARIFFVNAPSCLLTKLGLDQGGEEGIGGCATEEEAQSNIRQLREQLETLLAEETQLKETLQALDAEKAEARSGNLNQTFSLCFFADENIIDWAPILS